MKGKKYILGIITGSIITFMLMLSFANADEFGFEFNMFRININGIDKIQWGENIKDAKGEEVPGSICYKDTTYVPLRKIAEYFDCEVNYNDETKTILAYESRVKTERSQHLMSKKDLYEKEWRYFIVSIDDRVYLSVESSPLGNEKRLYRMPNDKSYKITDNSIYFLKCTKVDDIHQKATIALQRIDFLNDENSRDGIQIGGAVSTDLENATLLFDDNLIIGVFYVYFSTQAHSDVYIYDYKNDKMAYCYLRQTYAGKLQTEDTGDSLILKYRNYRAPTDDLYSVKFNKSTMEFYDSSSILTQSIH